MQEFEIVKHIIVIASHLKQYKTTMLKRLMRYQSVYDDNEQHNKIILIHNDLV